VETHGIGSDGLAANQIHFWRARDLKGMELIHGAHSTHSYPRHTHDEYAVSIITRGSETLSVGGAVHLIGVGSLIMLNPGQAHSNASSQGYAFRTFYIPEDLLMEVASELNGDRVSPPMFRSPAHARSRFFLPLLRLHKRLERSRSVAEQRMEFVALFRQILAEHAATREGEAPRLSEHRAVRRARRYLDSHFVEPVRLEQLSQVTQLSRFHLLRTFSEQVGMSPAEYQTAVRLSHAKSLLRRGHRIAQVAADVGFADQSHLTRRFKHAMGVTPGRYMAAGSA
jgi:AraC-like DNA-binding protein